MDKADLDFYICQLCGHSQDPKKRCTACALEDVCRTCHDKALRAHGLVYVRLAPDGKFINIVDPKKRSR